MSIRPFTALAKQGVQLAQPTEPLAKQSPEFEPESGFFGMNIAASELNLSLLTAIIWFFGAAIMSVSVALSIYIPYEQTREGR